MPAQETTSPYTQADAREETIESLYTQADAREAAATVIESPYATPTEPHLALQENPIYESAGADHYGTFPVDEAQPLLPSDLNPVQRLFAKFYLAFKTLLAFVFHEGSAAFPIAILAWLISEYIEAQFRSENIVIQEGTADAFTFLALQLFVINDNSVLNHVAFLFSERFDPISGFQLAPGLDPEKPFCGAFRNITTPLNKLYSIADPNHPITRYVYGFNGSANCPGQFGGWTATGTPVSTAEINLPGLDIGDGNEPARFALSSATWTLFLLGLIFFFARQSNSSRFEESFLEKMFYGITGGVSNAVTGLNQLIAFILQHTLGYCLPDNAQSLLPRAWQTLTFAVSNQMGGNATVSYIASGQVPLGYFGVSKGYIQRGILRHTPYNGLFASLNLGELLANRLKAAGQLVERFAHRGNAKEADVFAFFGRVISNNRQRDVNALRGLFGLPENLAFARMEQTDPSYLQAVLAGELREWEARLKSTYTESYTKAKIPTYLAALRELVATNIQAFWNDAIELVAITLKNRPLKKLTLENTEKETARFVNYLVTNFPVFTSILLTRKNFNDVLSILRQSRYRLSTPRWIEYLKTIHAKRLTLLEGVKLETANKILQDWGYLYKPDAVKLILTPQTRTTLAESAGPGGRGMALPPTPSDTSPIYEELRPRTWLAEGRGNFYDNPLFAAAPFDGTAAYLAIAPGVYDELPGAQEGVYGELPGTQEGVYSELPGDPKEKTKFELVQIIVEMDMRDPASPAPVHAIARYSDGENYKKAVLIYNGHTEAAQIAEHPGEQSITYVFGAAQTETTDTTPEALTSTARLLLTQRTKVQALPETPPPGARRQQAVFNASRPNYHTWYLRYLRSLFQQKHIFVAKALATGTTPSHETRLLASQQTDRAAKQHFGKDTADTIRQVLAAQLKKVAKGAISISSTLEEEQWDFLIRAYHFYLISEAKPNDQNSKTQACELVGKYANTIDAAARSNGDGLPEYTKALLENFNGLMLLLLDPDEHLAIDKETVVNCLCMALNKQTPRTVPNILSETSSRHDTGETFGF